MSQILATTNQQAKELSDISASDAPPFVGYAAT